MADYDVTFTNCDACCDRPAFLANDDHGQFLCVPCVKKFERVRKAAATRKLNRAKALADG